MDERKELPLIVEGMHCGGCVNRVTTALAKLDGVEVKSVEVGSALVAMDTRKVTEAEVVAAINNIGFAAKPAG